MRYQIEALTKTIAMTNFCPEEPEKKTSMNLPFTMHLHGEIDIPKLERSIAYFLEQQIMNSYLSEEDGEFYMNTKPHKGGFKLEVEDVDGQSVDEKLANLKAIAEARALVPLPIFEADQTPYLFNLFRISEEYHVLYMLVHHTFLDFAAVMITMGYIFKRYNDESYEYREAMDFSEFMEKELAFLASEGADAELAYWDKEMENLKQPKLLPEPYAEGEHVYTDEEMMVFFERKELEQIAKNERTSIFNILMLYTHMALAKVNDHYDTFIQYAISNREQEEYRYTLGCMTRTPCNRVIFDDDMNSHELHAVVRKKVGQGYQNRHVSGSMPLGSVPYIVADEDMTDLDMMPIFNGKPVTFDFVFVPREFNFIGILYLPVDAEHLGIFIVTDLNVYGKQSRRITTAMQLAHEFTTKYPERTFEDFMRKDITLETLDRLDEEDDLEIIEL